jgi:hypothetical protein
MSDGKALLSRREFLWLTEAKGLVKTVLQALQTGEHEA